jgi:hypothetical protein
VDEEAADELGGRERHRLEAFAPVEAVVLPPEGDAVAVARELSSKVKTSQKSMASQTAP